MELVFSALLLRFKNLRLPTKKFLSEHNKESCRSYLPLQPTDSNVYSQSIELLPSSAVGGAEAPDFWRPTPIRTFPKKWFEGVSIFTVDSSDINLAFDLAFNGKSDIQSFYVYLN